MNFRGKEWERFGNRYHLVGTQISVYQWNSGRNANFMVSAGYRNSNHMDKTISGKGAGARDEAIRFSMSIADRYAEGVAI